MVTTIVSTIFGPDCRRRLCAGLPPLAGVMLLPAAPAGEVVLRNATRSVLPHVPEAVTAADAQQVETLAGAWKGWLHPPSIATPADGRSWIGRSARAWIF